MHMETQHVADDEMLPTLLAQHNELRAEIKDMHEQAADPVSNANTLYDDMQALQKTIAVHITLEDGVFYPKLLKKMGEQHLDIIKTKEFIEQMKVIGAQMSAFLEEYNSVEKIKASPEKYREMLETVSSVLMIRISTEEDSVYLYWDM